MDTFTDQPASIRRGRNRGGCVILFIAVLILTGLAMWLYLWGRATPPADNPDPAVPTAEKRAA